METHAECLTIRAMTSTQQFMPLIHVCAIPAVVQIECDWELCAFNESEPMKKKNAVFLMKYETFSCLISNRVSERPGLISPNRIFTEMQCL